MLTPTDWWYANPFENWAWYFLGMLPIALLDALLSAACGNRARWFQLHSVTNALICIASLSEIGDILRDPAAAVMQPTTNYWGSILSFCLHLYHVCFFKLTVMDQYHHMISVFFCMPFSIIMRTKALSWIFFQATGLPGGIDYAMLALVKNGYMDKLLEKKYNAWINAYLRAPLGAIGTFMTYMVAVYGECYWQRIAAGTLAAIVFMNSCVFGSMAIENYVETRERRRAALICEDMRHPVVENEPDCVTTTRCESKKPLHFKHDAGHDVIRATQYKIVEGVPNIVSLTSVAVRALVGRFHHLRMTTAEATEIALAELSSLSLRITDSSSAAWKRVYSIRSR